MTRWAGILTRVMSQRNAGRARLALLGEDGQRMREVRGVLTGELDPAAVCWVREAEPDRVQPLPGQPQVGGQYRVGPVEPVADAGVPQRRHVHPDLVGPPGL